MLISVVIPTVRGKTLGHAIESVRRQSYENWELLVVTQGKDPSLDEVVGKAQAADGRIRRIHLERCGISLARNAGVREARGEIVAFTDDDCEADRDWLTVMAECFEAQPETGLVGGALIEPRWKRRGICKCPAVHPKEVTFDPKRTPHQPPDGWTWAGANFAVRKSALERVGPFDEYLGAGAVFPVAEETDIGFRLEELGVPMHCTPRAVVMHSYGHRYGLKSVMQNARNYAYGTGAMAGKLTLKGDPAGKRWLHSVYRQTLLDRRLYRWPFSVLRLKNFRAGYYRCIREFRIDDEGRNLVLR